MVKLYTLDQCRIETAETVLFPRAQLQFGLAMYLILERGKPIPRRDLMKLFWPDRPDDAAAHPLRETLRKLRRKGVPIPADDMSQRIFIPKNAAWVDVEGLGELGVQELLAQKYTILNGYEEGVSAEFDDWVDETRLHVQTQVIKQLGKVVEHTKVSADWQTTLEAAERILELSPDHLRAREVAMHARKILQSRAGDRLTGVASATVLEGLSVREQASRSGILTPKGIYRASRDTALVGRVEDLQVLTAALQDAINGVGSGVYLHGTPGIGKSRLVRELTNIAKMDGAAVRKTACQGYDTHRPLSVFVDIVPSLRKLPGAQGCYPDTYEYLDRLTRHDTAATPPRLEAHEVEYLYERIRHALFDLVEAVAHEQPLVFVVENIQWCDPHSWALLRDMTVRLQSHGVLFVFTSRDHWREETSGHRLNCVRDYCLLPLPKTAIAEHIKDYIAALDKTAEADFVEWCAQVAEGNPYLSEELVNHWASTGKKFSAPQSLQSLIDERLRNLDEAELRILQTCAVLGRNSSYGRLSSVLQYPDYIFLSAIETLGSFGMLTTPQDVRMDDFIPILCRHDVLAEQAIDSLSDQGLRLLHYKIGTLLEEELERLNSATLLWDCAQHWNAAGNTDRAIKLGLACAGHLSTMGLTCDAIKVCQKILDFCTTPQERISTLEIYIRVLHLACEWTQASNHFDELHNLRRTLDQENELHDDLELIKFDIAWNLSHSWNEVIESALHCVSSSSANIKHRVEAGLLLLKMGTNLGDTELMHQVYGTLSPLISTLEASDAALYLTFQIVYHAICGDTDTCISASEQLLEFSRNRFKGTRLARHILTCAIGFRRNGYQSRGDSLFIEVFNLSNAEKAYALAGIAAQQLVCCRLDEGNIVGAQEWINRFEELDRPMEELWGQRTFMITMIQFALEENNLEQAEHLFKIHTESFPQVSTVAARAKLIALRIRLYILQGIDIQSVAALQDELYPLHLKLRGMGLQDFLTYSLYLSMMYCGRLVEARDLLNTYASNVRRDRSPLLGKIAKALSEDPSTSKNVQRVLV